MSTRFLTHAACLLLLACDDASLAAFTKGKAEELCVESIPACPGRPAQCVLNSTRYTVVQFPGSLAFLVEADADEEIEVLMYFIEQRDAGFETIIDWNEPGCTEVQRFDSQGLDLFAIAGDRRIYSEKRRVFVGGEHLVEVLSDMQAELAITVDVTLPDR